MKPFRVREEQVNFRCTEAERQAIEEMFQTSGEKNFNTFLRKMVMNGYIVNVDYQDLKDLIYEINKIGTNINQIAHRVNADHALHQKDIEYLQKDLDNIWQLLRSKLMHVENNIVKTS